MVKKSIGIEAKAPEETCNDEKCPWHGKLSLRGRVFVGEVVSAKAAKSATVKWSFTRFVPKFERYERRSTRVTAYNPLCIKAKKGDMVKIMECRPLSKTKAFAVVEKVVA